jgi:hypothetical protein
VLNALTDRITQVASRREQVCRWLDCMYMLQHAATHSAQAVQPRNMCRCCISEGGSAKKGSVCASVLRPILGSLLGPGCLYLQCCKLQPFTLNFSGMALLQRGVSFNSTAWYC